MLLAVLYLLLVITAVLIHYEFLNFLSKSLSFFDRRHRTLVLMGVCGALAAHILEIIVFAVGYHVVLTYFSVGTLEGNFSGQWVDYVYFSFTTFTTLGFGDISPLGHIRLLVGLEALTGLVLITWSASFMFIEMQKFWSK